MEPWVKYETATRYVDIQLYITECIVAMYINIEDKWTLYGCIFNKINGHYMAVSSTVNKSVIIKNASRNKCFACA